MRSTSSLKRAMVCMHARPLRADLGEGAGMSGVLERHWPMVVIEINVARYADPAGFISRLRSVYGDLRYVAYDGYAQAVTEQELLSRNAGQDWLVVLSPEKPR